MDGKLTVEVEVVGAAAAAVEVEEAAGPAEAAVAAAGAAVVGLEAAAAVVVGVVTTTPAGLPTEHMRRTRLTHNLGAPHTLKCSQTVPYLLTAGFLPIFIFLR